MIKYIKYKREGGGIEIYEGEIQIEPFTIDDIINAINHRLRNIPNPTVTLSYHQYSEETCFLVKLAYDLDRLEQYIEKPNAEQLNQTVVLNFCTKEFVSIYSICFNNKRDFSKKSICTKTLGISFSYDIKAPLITLEEIRKNKFQIHFWQLLLGRSIYRDKLYYKFNEKGFCLPILELIEEMLKPKGHERYIKKIEFKINPDTYKVTIHVITQRSKYSKWYIENNYYGYLELNGFNYIIEKEEEEEFS